MTNIKVKTLEGALDFTGWNAVKASEWCKEEADEAN